MADVVEEADAAQATTPRLTYQDIEAADAAYEGIAPFSEWLASVDVDVDEWTRHLDQLNARRAAASPDAADRAAQFAIRAAVLDSGALEGLYEVDRGFTFAVAAETATWQIEMAERGPEVRSLFEAHLRGYELVMDVATQRTPISESWIRKLHEVICQPQDTYRVLTPQGWQDQPLPKGEYKRQPNHPFTLSGTLHSYAPVDATPAEMHSFVSQLQTDAFGAAHPVLQAAYAHYSLVAIHPFADGNGRVARALASVFLYRAASLPLVIYADQRDRYLDALRAADDRHLQPYAAFVYQRALGAIDRIGQLLLIGGLPPVEDSVARLRRVSLTVAGLTHVELDTLAVNLPVQVQGQFEGHITRLGLPGNVQAVAGLQSWGDPPSVAGYRRPINPQGPNGLVVTLMTSPPADARRDRQYEVLVSTSERSYGTFLVQRRDVADVSLEVPLAETHPEVSQELIARIDEYVAAQLQQALAELSEASEASLKDKGY